MLFVSNIMSKKVLHILHKCVLFVKRFLRIVICAVKTKLFSFVLKHTSKVIKKREVQRVIKKRNCY